MIFSAFIFKIIQLNLVTTTIVRLAILFPFILLQCAYSQYSIVEKKNLNSYKTISEKITGTVTACILSCENDKNCTLVAYEGNGNEGEGVKCIMLKEKGINDKKSNDFQPKKMNIVKKVYRLILIFNLRFNRFDLMI